MASVHHRSCPPKRTNDCARSDGTTSTPTISNQDDVNQTVKKWVIHICMVEKNEIYHLVFTGSLRKLTGKQIALCIEEHVGIPVQDQQLFFGDHEVRHDDTGKTLKIEDGATFVLFSRCPDGCCNPSTTSTAPTQACTNCNENRTSTNKSSHTSSNIRSLSPPKSAAFSFSTGEEEYSAPSFSPGRSPPGLSETEDTSSSHGGMGVSRSTPPFRDLTPSRSPSCQNPDDAVKGARKEGESDADGPQKFSSSIPLRSSTPHTSAGIPQNVPLPLYCSHYMQREDFLLLRALLFSSSDRTCPTAAPPRLKLAGVSAAFKTYTTPIQSGLRENKCNLYHSRTSSQGTTTTSSNHRSCSSTRMDGMPTTLTTMYDGQGVSVDSTQCEDGLSKPLSAVESDPCTENEIGTLSDTSNRTKVKASSTSTFIAMTTKTTTPPREIQREKMEHYSSGSSRASSAPPSVEVTTQRGKKTSVTLSSEKRSKSFERDLRAASASTSLSNSDSAFLFCSSTFPSPSFI